MTAQRWQTPCPASFAPASAYLYWPDPNPLHSTTHCPMFAKRLKTLRAVAAILGAAASVHAVAACHDTLTPAELSGKGELCIFGFCFYDAQLWSTKVPVGYDAPFALEVTYRRAVTGTRLIETAIDEIRRMQAPPPSDATLSRWQEAMTPAFTDVKPGDTLCGVYLPGRGALFYTNGHLMTEVDDPAFAHAFFDIWLGRGTRAPSLRRSLLGEAR